MHNTKKYLHTFNSGLICANKAARQLLCSLLLFCFRELNCFLKISVRDPRKKFFECFETQSSKLGSWTSKIETRNSSLENFEDRESSFESRLSTYISSVDSAHPVFRRSWVWFLLGTWIFSLSHSHAMLINCFSHCITELKIHHLYSLIVSPVFHSVHFIWGIKWFICGPTKCSCSSFSSLHLGYQVIHLQSYQVVANVLQMFD